MGKMELIFYNNFEKQLEKILKIKKESKLPTGLIINTTSKRQIDPILLPIKKTKYLISVGVTIFDKKSLLQILKKIDGFVDFILVDDEQKIEGLSKIRIIVEKNIKKSEILFYKTNDYTAESTDVFLQQFLKLSKKKISIVGTGNIGTKVALKLIERGIDVNISKRKITDSKKIVNALNVIKPKASTGNIFAKSNNDISKNCDVLICFSNNPVIDEKMIKQMSNNGIIIDGGIGTIKEEAIILAHKKNIKITRLDIRAGLSGSITTLFETRELVKKIMGFKKIENIIIVAGGFYGKIGNVVVDRIDRPTEIIGIADGKGGLIRKNYSSTDKKRIKTINSWIKKNN